MPLSEHVPVLPRIGSSIEIAVKQAGGAVIDRSFHARGDIRDQVGDFQLTLHMGLEVRHLFRRGGVLEVIERAAIRDRRHQRAQLQRSHLNSLAKGAHAAYAALACGDGLIRICAQLLAGDIPTCELPKPNCVA